VFNIRVSLFALWVPGCVPAGAIRFLSRTDSNQLNFA